jgi:hypothetical protein
MTDRNLDDRDLEQVQGGTTIEPTTGEEPNAPRIYTGSPEVKKEEEEEDPTERGEGVPL